MSAYSDEQSEDGELARSPAPPHMDFSLSEDEPDTGDSLDIKPPQAKLRADRIKDERRSRHVKSERRKEHSRSHKKHVYRDREQLDPRAKRELEVVKHSERDLFHNKEYYREREYVREKEVYRDKEAYRAREHYKDKEYKEKDAYREADPYREKDVYREKEAYRIKEAYRDRDHHKDKEAFRDKEFYREKDSYREKDPYREKDVYLIREKDRSQRHGESDRSKAHRHVEIDRKAVSREDARLRHIESNDRLKDQTIRYVEKENREKPGNKELDDLRSRLLIKRQQTKEQQEVSRKHDEDIDENEERDLRSTQLPELDKSQLERRNKLLKIEREMSHCKKTSRAALEARREKKKEDGAKRSCPSSPVLHKKRRHHSRPNSPSAITPEEVVMVSDESDVEIKSDGSQHSNNSEEGTASSSESSSETSAEDSETEEEEDEDDDGDENRDRDGVGDTDKSEETNHKIKPVVQKENKSKEEDDGNSTEPPSPSAIDTSPASTHSITPKHRSSRSRSRSNSFSPPPVNENGADPEPILEKPAESPPPTPTEEKDDLPPYYPGLQGCRSVEEFQCLNKIEEGTYGVVYRARDKTTDEIVALKRLKMEKEKEGFPITSLREINTLLKGQHPNIVTVREIVVGSNMDKIFIVMDYVEHDLKGLMETMRSRKQVFLPGEVKCLMQQLLRAVDHLHDNWILHRDLKTSNLLLSHKGILKVGDFGLAREYGSPLKSYTPIVVTLWYRAPELLLGARQYSTPIDIWSVGCIFAEFIAMNALFPGKSEVDQLNRIFKELGTPNEKIWPGWSSLSGSRATWADQPGRGLRFRVGQNLSELGLNLLSSLLTYDPQQRATANQALNHMYFKEQPLAIDPGMFPTWPAKSEGGRRHQHSPKPPSGGDQYKMLKEDDQAALGFHMNAPGSALMTSYLPPSSGFSLKF